MTKQQAQELYDWNERKKLMVSPGFSGSKEDKIQEEIRRRAEEMVRKTQEMFGLIHVVKEQPLDAIIDELRRQYPSNDEISCKRWVASHKRFKPSDKAEVLWNSWIKIGRAAKEYFTSEMVERLWKE